jgi:AcrR family transcriptional regulator
MRRSSADTKAAILAAARDRFALDGYERTTVRAIAADANIDPSMVMRYFGTKDDLFAAAAAEPDLHLPNLARLPRRELGQRLVRHFLDRWETDETLQVLLRTAGTNALAAQRMRQIFHGQLATALMITPARSVSESQDRAGLVASQMLGMALCRYVLRLPPLAEMPTDAVVAWLGPTIQSYVVGARTRTLWDESGAR